MIARNRGKIINVCSVQSELGRPSIAPYAASKGAVKMLTKGMCADWAPHGIAGERDRPRLFRDGADQAARGERRVHRLAPQAHASRPLGPRSRS